MAIEGVEVFKKSLEVGIVPQVCGVYTLSTGTKCNICTIIKENKNNQSEQCLVASATVRNIIHKNFHWNFLVSVHQFRYQIQM